MWYKTKITRKSLLTKGDKRMTEKKELNYNLFDPSYPYEKITLEQLHEIAHEHDGEIPQELKELTDNLAELELELLQISSTLWNFSNVLGEQFAEQVHDKFKDYVLFINTLVVAFQLHRNSISNQPKALYFIKED
jgi:CHAT domain-containing protein